MRQMVESFLDDADMKEIADFVAATRTGISKMGG
jgi:cytochrome c553